MSEKYKQLEFDLGSLGEEEIELPTTERLNDEHQPIENKIKEIAGQEIDDFIKEQREEKKLNQNEELKIDDTKILYKASSILKHLGRQGNYDEDFFVILKFILKKLDDEGIKYDERFLFEKAREEKGFLGYRLNNITEKDKKIIDTNKDPKEDSYKPGTGK